jgi:hypothetical protein
LVKGNRRSTKSDLPDHSAIRLGGAEDEAMRRVTLKQAGARYPADAPDNASWEMRWLSTNSRSAGVNLPPSVQELSDGWSDIVRATKSVTCFGNRRGAAVLGEQNAPVAMAVNMH